MSGRRIYKRSTYQRFLLLLLVLPIPLYLLTGWFNYHVDPLWCFKHANCDNCVQGDIDDRQLKTNFLTFRGESYDTLLVGNSRVMIMNQNDFGPHTFNYAVAGMIPKEFPAYIKYAKQVNGREFKRIVFGLSFAHINDEVGYYAGKGPSYYIDGVQNPLYRCEMLFNWDVFKHSLANYNYSHARHPNITVYTDRDNIRHVRRERVKLDENIAGDLASTTDAYRNHFRYFDGYRPLLQSIKADNPSTEFKVFTTPVTQPLFCAMVTAGRLPEYERWLRETVEVFGEVYHFEYLNSVTRDYRRYYMDGHHFYPETGTLVTHKVLGVPDPALPADFGMVVNRDNLEQKVKEIEASAAACSLTAGGAAPASAAHSKAAGMPSEPNQPTPTSKMTAGKTTAAR